MTREIANLTSIASPQQQYSPDIAAGMPAATGPVPIGLSPMATEPVIQQAASSLAGVIDPTSELAIDADSVFLGASVLADSKPASGQAGVLQPAGQPASLVKFSRGRV